jgi:excisionase family DNA binding protein
MSKTGSVSGRGRGPRGPRRAPARQEQPPRQPQTEMPLTMTVPEAGRHYLGIGKTLAYEAAARGEIPTVRVGRAIRVPVWAMERMLDEAGSKSRVKREGDAS